MDTALRGMDPTDKGSGMKTWQQKIGKRLLKHVRETTERGTLREVRSNYEHQENDTSWTCADCARVIQLTTRSPRHGKRRTA